MAAGASLRVVDNDGLSIRDLALNKNHGPTLEVLKDFIEEGNLKQDLTDNFSCEVVFDWKEMYPGILGFDK